MGFDGAIPFVNPSGAKTTAEATLFRVFKAVPCSVDDDVFAKAESLLLSPLLCGNVRKVRKMSKLDWIKSMRVSRRRKILRRVLDRLQDRGSYHKHFRRIKPFSKREKLARFAVLSTGPSVDHTEYIPRLIQAPHDETHLVAGPYLKPLTNALKEAWDVDNWIFYASVEPHKLNQWINTNADSISFWLGDYSAYDATWTKQAWSLLRKFYKAKIENASADFWEVLDIWERPNGVFKDKRTGFGFRYASEACNASGRDDTALANALLNGVVMALSITAAYFRKDIGQLTKWDLIKMKQLIRIAIVGDDSLVAASFDLSKISDAIVANIKLFGLVVKPKVVKSIDHITFLGMMPYETMSGYTWGPTIARSLYKAYWQLEPSNLPAWTKGVAMQYSQFSNVPILSDISNRVLQLLPSCTARSVAYDEDRPWTQASVSNPKWDEKTVAQLCRRYEEHGLTPLMIQADLRTIEGITRLPAVVRLGTFDVSVMYEEL